MTLQADNTVASPHLGHAADIVAAYVSKNPVPAGELSALITNVHNTILGLGQPAPRAGADIDVEKPSPAQIKKSIQPDGLISFIDGKPYKTLKRHLTKHGLDIAGYKKRYGLPNDYPTVAASYSEQRSSLAKALGLGQPGARAAAETVPAPETKTRTPRGGAKAAH